MGGCEGGEPKLICKVDTLDFGKKKPKVASIRLVLLYDAPAPQA